MVTVGVIGCGYWGPNLIRNFNSLPDCEMTICCDKDQDKLKRMDSLFKGIKTTDDYRELLDGGIDAVCVATPVWTHYPLAMECLNAEKHLLVENPLASAAAETREIIDLA